MDVNNISGVFFINPFLDIYFPQIIITFIESIHYKSYLMIKIDSQFFLTFGYFSKCI